MGFGIRPDQIEESLFFQDKISCMQPSAVGNWSIPKLASTLRNSVILTVKIGMRSSNVDFFQSPVETSYLDKSSLQRPEWDAVHVDSGSYSRYKSWNISVSSMIIEGSSWPLIFIMELAQFLVESRCTGVRNVIRLVTIVSSWNQDTHVCAMPEKSFAHCRILNWWSIKSTSPQRGSKTANKRPHVTNLYLLGFAWHCRVNEVRNPLRELLEYHFSEEKNKTESYLNHDHLYMIVTIS